MEPAAVLRKIRDLATPSPVLEPVDDIYRARWRGATWYVPNPDPGQARWCFDFLASHERFLDVLEPGMTVLEVGAATGEYTVPAARRIRGGTLYAFEAEPRNHRCLRRNLLLHGADNVAPIHRAVSDEVGRKPGFGVTDVLAQHRFDVDAEGADGHGFWPERQAHTILDVETTTVDAFAAEHGLPSLDMLKLTVNGHEAAVLRGAAGVLGRTRYVSLNVPYEECFDVLEAHGFAVAERCTHDALGEPILFENEARG